MGARRHECRFNQIIDHKSIILLKRLKRRSPSFNTFRKRMLAKNILVGLDDTFYFIDGKANDDDIEKFFNHTAG